MATMHRRKSSKEEDENLLILSNGSTPSNENVPVNIHIQVNGHSQTNSLIPPTTSRSRVSSSPAGLHAQSHSSSQLHPNQLPPLRTGLPFPRQPSTNGTTSHPTSPFRNSFSIPPQPHLTPSSQSNSHTRSHSHSRTRSVSGPFVPTLPSPLSTSFPHIHQPQLHPPTGNGSFAFPTAGNSPELSSNASLGMASAPAHGRRHSRLHSRNLSIFFPRPGSLPHSTIAEDGVEAERPPDVEAPVTLMPSAQSEPLINGSQKRLGDGFTFGARPPSSVSLDSVHSAVGGTRRGHHHKHSLSHNFFSFLEPGSQPSAADLHTSPTPVPTSPWSPVSTISRSASSSTTSLAPSALDGPRLRTTSDSSEVEHRDVPPSVSTSAAVIAVAQFFLGAWVWVSGQQIGSLACTGLGYWIVFDAFGISLAEVVPGYLAGKELQSKLRRPYGNGRVETVFMFAQSVYLMFASVYVCKETVEHLLLSAGEGHHHHHGDELADNLGIEFPVLLVFITLISLLGTSLSFNHHSKLVNIAGNHLSSPLSIIRSTLKPYPSSSTFTHPLPTSRAGMLFSNPFAVAPIVFCISILLFAAFLPLSQYRPFDLGLASVEALLTFNVAYKACVVLGTVLLQTSPDRSLSGVRMDAFARALREVERHHQVLHLPTPHVWQLTPTQQHAPAKSLVVTLELHVREDLSDSDVLELTRWAWERVVSALRLGSRSVGDSSGEAEVTVGVVRE